MKSNHFGSLSIRLLTLKQSASFRKLVKIVQKFGITFGTHMALRKLCRFSFLFYLSIPQLKFGRHSLSTRVITTLDLALNGALILFTKKCYMLHCNVAMKVINEQ